MLLLEFLLIFKLCFLLAKSQTTTQSPEGQMDIATIETNTKNLQDLVKGMPETLSFTLNTLKTNKPIILNLKLKKSLKENSFVYVVRQDENGTMVVVKQNIPINENIGLYQDKSTGAAFTVKCEGLENGYCNPIIYGSIHIDDVEYDLSEISTADLGLASNPITNPMTSSGPISSRQKRAAKKDKKKNKKEKNKKNKNEKNKKNKELKQERRRQRKEEKQRRKQMKKEQKRQRRVYKFMKRKRKHSFKDDVKIFDRDTTNNLISKEISLPLGKAMSFSMSDKIIEVSDKKFPVLGRSVVSSSVQRNDLKADDTYNVELLIVVDYSIYKREFDAISDRTVFNKDIEAKSRIRQYFAHVVNGMNLRYDNIDTSRFHINVAVSGYIIADIPAISVWTAGNSGGLVDSDDALDSLRSWRLNVAELPEHDHMMLFTGYDLYRYNRQNNGVTGLASFGAMCSASSVSVVEDNGLYGCISTGTHELAHSLGARHDGNGNICSSRSKFIMATTGGATDSNNELNPWRFSSCSIEDMHSFLTSLGPGNCLMDEALIYDSDEFNRVTKDEAGQVYNVNDQCRQRAGKNSFYGWGGGLGEFQDICTSMACKSETSASSYLIYTAARGTSCGDKRWCLNGICTYDPRAPSKDDNCVHGDSQRLFEGQTCSELIQDDPVKCYETYYRDFCCQSCKDIEQPIRGCEYGDKNSYCTSVIDRPNLCYSPRNEDICCQSCRDINTGYSGCEYNDKVHEVFGGRCDIRRCAGDPDYQKSCCKTCGLIPDIPATRPPTRPPPNPVTTRPKTPKPATARPTTPKPRPPPVVTTQRQTRPPVVTTKRPPPIRTTALPRPPPPKEELCVRRDGMFRTMTCDVLARLISSICSVSVLQGVCCEPCATTVPAMTCRNEGTCLGIAGHHCYDNFIRDDCCESCQQFKTNDQDCQYGDKSSFCQRYMALWPEYVCSRHATTCCGSCKTRPIRRGTITILSRKTENKIANELSPDHSGLGFDKSLDVNMDEAGITPSDGPTRGDEIPIDTGKKGKDKKKGRGKQGKGKGNKGKGKGGGKDNQGKGKGKGNKGKKP